MYGVVGHSFEGTERKKKKSKSASKNYSPKPSASIRAGVIIGGAVLGCKLPGAPDKGDELRTGTLDLKEGGRLLNYSDKLTIGARDRSFHLNSRELPALAETSTRGKTEKFGWKDRFRRKRYDGGTQTSSFGGGNGYVQNSIAHEPVTSQEEGHHELLGTNSGPSYSSSPSHVHRRFFDSLNRGHCSRADVGCSSGSRCETPRHIDSRGSDVRIPMEKDYVEYEWSEARAMQCAYSGKCIESKYSCDGLAVRNSEYCAHTCVPCSSYASTRHRFHCRRDVDSIDFHQRQQLKSDGAEIPHSTYSDVPIPAAFRSSFSLSDNLCESSPGVSDACCSDLSPNDPNLKSTRKTNLVSKSRSENLLSYPEKDVRHSSKNKSNASPQKLSGKNKSKDVFSDIGAASAARASKSVENIFSDDVESDVLADNDASTINSGRKTRVSKSSDDLQSQATITHSSTQTPIEPQDRERKEDPREAAKRRRERERRRREAALPFIQRLFLMIKRLSGTEDEDGIPTELKIRLIYFSFSPSNYFPNEKELKRARHC